MRFADVAALGHDLKTENQEASLYRLIQSAPVGPGRLGDGKNFGRGRPYPIVNWFRDPAVAVTPRGWDPGAARSTE
jgi:hypothetical protein